MRKRLLWPAVILCALLLAATINILAADEPDTVEENGPLILNTKEAQAVADLQSLHDVCIAYRDTTSGFPEDLNVLTQGNSPSISKELAGGENQKIGYHYYYNYIDRDRYEISAEADPPQRAFYIDEQGEVKLGDKFGPTVP